ncbi:hypothetical protein COU23_00180 [Candidatus Kuenenbacteria bacterium CG10_big_fil_rev_8_21_14_0_10_36_11]|uniref:Solute-binding protein family 5 domain-containing protein n=1 Tax=Candidatus Kuenenbacteria bacterium CG10_big_fil_rev_8_21_14_0_10_36_11 TaxID=1974618 RepID=A0A2M6WBD2_9BACT|nr:MAG: hypothetical protein COU23_00180 [Candidatus Kuenenbacteria bacterium CG10_big_fil_rev_8_21_14_0_10_36_11]
MSNFLDILKKIFSPFYILKPKLLRAQVFFRFFKKKFEPGLRDDLDQRLFINLNKTKKKWPGIRQWKYLNAILLAREKNKIKIAAAVLVLTIFGLLVNLYYVMTVVGPKNGGEYSEGLVGLPKLINPLYASLNQVDSDLSGLVYSGLVKIDNQGLIGPDLAGNWQISPDGKIYTFYLKNNLKFHDGIELIADDVVFTIEAIQNPSYKSPLEPNFQGVKVEKVDETALRFILSEPYAPFLENLTVGILPQHIWAEVAPVNMALADYNLKPIGSGPFKFKSFAKDKLGNLKTYTLGRNELYYEQPPYLETLTFKFYTDYNSAADALKNHNIDGLSFIPKDLKDNLATRKDLNYCYLRLPQYTALFFNQANNAALKELKVRQVLAFGLDKKEIVAQALGAGEVIDGPIFSGMIGYHPNIKKYNFNPTEAEALLDAAGYLQKQGEPSRKKGEAELKITLTTVNKAENASVAGLISKMWLALGIKVQLNLVDANQIKDIIKNRSFEVLLFGEILGADPDPYPFWHSSEAGSTGLNLANFINKDADKLLEDARKSFDPTVRHEKYVQFQNILAENLPAIFLYTPQYVYPITGEIKGIETQNITTPAGRFCNIENWYVKTKRVLK